MNSNDHESGQFDRELPPLPSEQLAMDHIAETSNEAPTNCLVMSPGRGQTAWLIERLYPDANIVSWFVDSHRAAEAERAAKNVGSRVTITCHHDLPDASLDLAVLPVLRTGEAEMNRDLLQQAYQRLRIGGRMVASVNAPKDHWLLAQMQQLFAKVNCHSSPLGWLYIGRKQTELKKVRNFDSQIDFPVDERIITTFSRPSVFSHRSIDTAARVMIRQVAIPEGVNVLELGCGNGGVALAAAARSVSGTVYAVDSNARAVQCTRRAMQVNKIENMVVMLNHDGNLGEIQRCDIALLNPPYYGDFAIAEHFVNTAAKYLCVGGKVWAITKQAEKYHDREWSGLLFHEATKSQGYDLICYRKL